MRQLAGCDTLKAHRSRQGEERPVPKLEVEGAGTFDVERDKRLVLAIEEDAGDEPWDA